MFEWDERKSREIENRHGIGFPEIVKAITCDAVIIPVPNKDRDQKAFLTFVRDYPFVVPFEIRGTKYRLITAWPDRRYKDG